MAAVALAMVMALRMTIYADAPDIGYHIGKIIWAVRGQPLIDPVMGITTGYPPFFHILGGWLSRLTGEGPAVLLRWSTAWNLVGLWFVIWWFGKRLAGENLASVTLWLASLSLFAKDVSEILFANPACASMPLAAAAWWIWATESRWRHAVLGAFLLGCAILLWPTHLFGALGVGLMMGWRRIKDPKAWLYAASVLMALAVGWVTRQAVPGGESWSGLQLLPADFAHFLLTRAQAIVTLGTNAHGPWLALAGAGLLGLLIALAVKGTQSKDRLSHAQDLWHLSLGLSVGALLAYWFMIQPPHGTRVLFLAVLVPVPWAALGLRELPRIGLPKIVAHRNIWLLGAGLVWLLPFLIATSASTERQHRWTVRTKEVSDFLSERAKPGERVWASPDTYCNVVLGKMPVFGLLGHRWPLYFGAPAREADSIATVYAQISSLNVTDDWQGTLRRNAISWVILDRDLDSRMPLATTLSANLAPVFNDPAYVVYKVRPLSD
ncbi:MAG: hypothetical protein HY304_09995 [candidate division Zixibacteria bacterium]|nr:hypothetical protein [candidate division Zixibacteria bacterium]